MKWEEYIRAANGYALGRNALPSALWDAYNDQVLDSLDEYAKALEDAWVASEFPAFALGPDEWEELFNSVGFLVDGRRAPKECPKAPIRLYRAAHPEHRHGMSWTDDIEIAKWFHKRNLNFNFHDAVLLRIDAHPMDVLARFHAGRNEREWVVAERGTYDAVEVDA